MKKRKTEAQSNCKNITIPEGYQDSSTGKMVIKFNKTEELNIANNIKTVSTNTVVCTKTPTYATECSIVERPSNVFLKKLSKWFISKDIELECSLKTMKMDRSVSGIFYTDNKDYTSDEHLILDYRLAVIMKWITGR